MNKLVTKRCRRDLVNDLTREMDTYVEYPSDIFNTYILDDSFEYSDGSLGYAIRYPGATRGQITVDRDMIITDIKLYKDETRTHLMYLPEVEECFKKYIGMELVINRMSK